jgi:ligand-binding SRPBCC domain-containing protein
MAEHVLSSELTIDLPLVEVFDFFADAENLERITPPELNFKILTPRPIVIEKGTLIDYQLSLYGLPMKWRTEISVWDPPFGFVDRQLSGPYSQWIHWHKFIEISPNETIIEDTVRYRLPLEPFGDIAHFIVRRQLERIFDFRQKAVAEILLGKESRSGGPFAAINKIGAAG